MESSHGEHVLDGFRREHPRRAGDRDRHLGHPPLRGLGTPIQHLLRLLRGRRADLGVVPAHRAEVLRDERARPRLPARRIPADAPVQPLRLRPKTRGAVRHRAGRVARHRLALVRRRGRLRDHLHGQHQHAARHARFLPVPQPHRHAAPRWPARALLRARSSRRGGLVGFATILLGLGILYRAIKDSRSTPATASASASVRART
jgi:hypothetical protein